MTIEQARLRLEALLRPLVARPETADLVPEIERIYQALRDQVWFLGEQKRQLDALRQELQAL